LSQRGARLLTSIALVSAAWAVIVAVTGGGRVVAGPLRLSARSVTAPALVAALACVAVVVLSRRAGQGGAVGNALGWASARIETRASWLAATVAAATLVTGIAWGTGAVGGSDSYCYVGQAEMMAAGTLRQPVPLGFDPPWRDPGQLVAPAGFVPSPVVPGGIAPICPAGLALVMAVPVWLGWPGGLFVVVPLFGGLGVWSVFVLARHLRDGVAGIAASVLAATAPVFLYQLVQPMSDVPAAALWTAALAAAAGGGVWRSVVAGLLAGAAITMRPNLAPLAVFVWGLAWVGGEGIGPRGRLRRAVSSVAATAPGVLVVAMLQWRLYGSPFASGYGSLSALFSLSHVAPNLARYSRWLVETQTPLVLLGLAAPWFGVSRSTSSGDGAWHPRGRVGPATEGRAVEALVVLGFSAACGALYLPYVVFEEWWYLRFLLPGLLPLAALVGVTLSATTARLPAALRAPALVAGLAALGAWQVTVAHERSAFELRALESRFAEAGRFVDARLPREAVVLTVWHSGSIRHYANRVTLVWRALDPRGLDEAVSWLERRGRPVYLLLEDWEEPDFRARFGTSSRAGELSWPPTAQVGRSVRIWRFADRERYERGDAVRTERIGPAPGARR
jgi:hypothetical protein